MTLLLETPGWLVLWYMRRCGPVLSAFNQGRKQNLWDCTGILTFEFVSNATGKPGSFISITVFYETFCLLRDIPSFYSRLQGSFANQIGSPGFSHHDAAGRLQGVTWMSVWHLLLAPEIFPLASAGSLNWSFPDVDDLILLLLRKKKTWESSVLKPLYKGQRSWQGGHAIPETINTLPYDSVHGLATTHIDTCLICRRWQDLGWEGGQGQQTGWETGICYNVCQYRLWGAMII